MRACSPSRLSRERCRSRIVLAGALSLLAHLFFVNHLGGGVRSLPAPYVPRALDVDLVREEAKVSEASPLAISEAGEPRVRTSASASRSVPVYDKKSVSLKAEPSPPRDGRSNVDAPDL